MVELGVRTWAMFDPFGVERVVWRKGTLGGGHDDGGGGTGHGRRMRHRQESKFLIALPSLYASLTSPCLSPCYQCQLYLTDLGRTAIHLPVSELSPIHFYLPSALYPSSTHSALPIMSSSEAAPSSAPAPTSDASSVPSAAPTTSLSEPHPLKEASLPTMTGPPNQEIRVGVILSLKPTPKVRSSASM